MLVPGLVAPLNWKIFQIFQVDSHNLTMLHRQIGPSTIFIWRSYFGETWRRKCLYINIYWYVKMPVKNNLLLFKALGEETTFRIIKLLLKNEGCICETGEYCACEIPSLIKRTQSNTSMQLAKLQDWGIIQSRRDGKKILYSIRDKRVCDIFKLILKWW